MRQRTEGRQLRIQSVLSKRQPDLTLVMDNIHDPHNVSAILRSCDAFGVGSVHLYYTTENFPRPGRKSSASAMKWVRLHRHSDAKEMARTLSSQSLAILGARCSPSAVPIHTWDFSQPAAIILGNEHSGLSPELEPYLTQEVFIPMQGMVESFNVSVAAAILLYEAWRQRHLLGMYDKPAMDTQTLEDLFALWIQK